MTCAHLLVLAPQNDNNNDQPFGVFQELFLSPTLPQEKKEKISYEVGVIVYILKIRKLQHKRS